MFFLKRDKKIRVFISIRPEQIGGGSNTFAYNLAAWINSHNKYKVVKNILRADKAIIISHVADLVSLRKAKGKGCFIVHRVDEFFEKNVFNYRKKKHSKIIEINKLADVTVYQSDFVYRSVKPHLSCPHYKVIINGADNNLFKPAGESGDYIGHVSWSPNQRKRFDLLYELIAEYPHEKFLLIGNHNKTEYDFLSFPNVKQVGPVNREDLVKHFHMMKMLYLPSENDPCPNTAVEAVLSGVPVCYNEDGGTREIVRDCGLPLNKVDDLLHDLALYRRRCFDRQDLHFDQVALKYMSLV